MGANGILFKVDEQTGCNWAKFRRFDMKNKQIRNSQAQNKIPPTIYPKNSQEICSQEFR